MKLLKYISIAALAMVAVACSDDDNPTVKSPGVYYGDDNTTKVNLSPVEGAPTSFEVAIWRTDNKEAQTVPVTYTTESPEFFTVPSEATFAAGSYKTSITVDCSLTNWTIGESKSITFGFGDGVYVSDYAYAGSFTKEVVLYYTFKSLGKVTMIDNWITVLFSDLNQAAPYEVEMEESEQVPGFLRIVNPFGKSFAAGIIEANPTFNAQPAYDESKVTYYLEIHAEDPNLVYAMPQPATGNPWYSRFAQVVGTFPGMMINLGTPLENMTSDPENYGFGKTVDGAVKVPAGGFRFFYTNGGAQLDNNGRGYSNIAFENVFYTLPGVALQDFSCNLSYIGILNVDKSGSEAMLSQEFGEDVVYAKYAIVNQAPDDVDPIFEGINDGTIASQWIEDIENPYLRVPVKEDGNYTVAVVTYGHDNEVPKGRGYVQFKVTLSADSPTAGMELWGDGVFIDGWVLAGFGKTQTEPYNPAEYKFLVEIWRDTKNKQIIGVHSPYGENSFAGNYVKAFGNTTADEEVMIKVDASDVSCVCMAPQYSGFTRAGWGAVSIANFEGLLQADKPDASKADIVAYMDEKGVPFTTYENGVMTIPNPRFNRSIADGEKWYMWQNAADAGIWMPGSFTTGIMKLRTIEGQCVAPSASKLSKDYVTRAKMFNGKIKINVENSK